MTFSGWLLVGAILLLGVGTIALIVRESKLREGAYRAARRQHERELARVFDEKETEGS